MSIFIFRVIINSIIITFFPLCIDDDVVSVINSCDVRNVLNGTLIQECVNDDTVTVNNTNIQYIVWKPV